MIIVLAMIGGTVVLYACIMLIIGIITRKNPLRDTPDRKLGRVDLACVTFGTLGFIILASLIVYWQATDHEMTQSGWDYHFCVVSTVVLFLVNVVYYCVLIHNFRKYKNTRKRLKGGQ